MSNSEYFSQSLFEEEKAVPEPGLSKASFPEEYAKAYHPTRNRIVIQYTDEQEETLKQFLGLQEIKEIAYNFEDLRK